MEQLYYIIVNGKQTGPFSKDELKTKGIYKDTLVWTEGLDSWTKAEYIPMIKDILRATPPPIFNTETKTNFQSPPIPKQISITENFVLREKAKESLKEKWALAIGTCALYSLIIVVISLIPYIGSVIVLIIAGSFQLGLSYFSLALSRNKEAKLEQIFDGFKDFERAFVAHLLQTLYTFLWALLLIIPGIIAGLSYSMTFYIMADDKSIRASEAIVKSKTMMYGYKWKLFYLMLGFIGWGILCILTLGLGFLLLIPYMKVTMAKFYDDLKTHTAI